MAMRWQTWKHELENRLQAYITPDDPEGDDVPNTYGIWGEYYLNGTTPEETANDYENGIIKPTSQPEIEYWYLMLDAAIRYLRNTTPRSGWPDDSFLIVKDSHLAPLERHDILVPRELATIEERWNSGDYDAVVAHLTRKRDNYVNPAPLPATLDEAAQAATVLLRCDTKDLTKWTGGLWTERGLWADRAVRLGLKAICEKQRKAIRYEITAKNNDTRINSFVLAHVENMPPEQWDYFRQHNDDNMTKRDVIQSSLMRSGGMSMKQYLECLPEALQIGAIDKSPVYFSPERGIYIWEPSESEDPFVREIWLTYPTMPKDWS